jgi:hypothetical protein
MKESWFCAVRESLWRCEPVGVSTATAVTGSCSDAVGGAESAMQAPGHVHAAPRSRRTNHHSAVSLSLSARVRRPASCTHAVRGAVTAADCEQQTVHAQQRIP